ncbi:MAG: alpha/beta fold hydrolase, partial [Cycloclasticus sp.]
MIILHGLFGSARNWQGIAKQLSNHFSVFTVDLRNHGSSAH